MNKVYDQVNYQNSTYYQKGNMPLLLTAPHGGSKRIGTKDRTKGVVIKDDDTLQLAFLISDNIHQFTGQRPYLVAADFSRKDIDANRNSNEAYEDPKMALTYNFYHQMIREYINDIKRKYGNAGLLLDIHGQGAQPDTIFRGTSNEKTANRDSINSLKSLSNRGYNVIPNGNNLLDKEDNRFVGGWTVRHYGINNPNGINAIQIELGSNLRSRNKFADQFAQDLAISLLQNID